MRTARIQELWVLPWLAGAALIVLLSLNNELNPQQIAILCDLSRTIGGLPEDCPQTYVRQGTWLTAAILMAAFAALTLSMVRVVRDAARRAD